MPSQAWSFYVFASLLILQALNALPQQSGDSEYRSGGRYVPELHGAQLGKYLRDDSGKYSHIKIPYDGGYGDRGLKYTHTAAGIFQRPPEDFKLGPQDHLRFMIDFNYNGTGWQIIEFEWVRDDDDSVRYNYLNENRLWGDHGEASENQSEIEQAAMSAKGLAESEVRAEGYAEEPPMPSARDEISPMFAVEDNESTNVHVEGEYEANTFNVTYSDETSQQRHDVGEVRNAIWEVLEYVQAHILPALA